MSLKVGAMAMGVAALMSGRISGCGGSDGTAKVYVANEDDGTVSVVNAETNKVLSTIDTMEMKGPAMYMFMAHNVQVAPDGGSVWVTAPAMDGMIDAGQTPDEVIVIDPTKDEITNRVTLGYDLHPAHVVLDSASRFAYVTAYATSEVYEIDAGTYAVTRTFALTPGSGPHGERYCDGQLFVAEMDGQNLAIIDTVTGNFKEVPVGGMAVQTACTADGRYAFVSLYDTREVVRYDVTTGELTRIALPPQSEGPVQVYLSPDDQRLYVADQGMLLGRPASNLLFEIDAAAAQVSATIDVGAGAHGVVVSPDGTRAYVTNQADNTVSVVDLDQKQAIATVAVGTTPNGISEWTAGGGTP